ncbi:MAG: ATP-dependent zinc metalloprotease FtsH [Limisphaerales bacterium]
MKKKNVQPPPLPDDPSGPRKPGKWPGRSHGWLLIYLVILLVFIWFWHESSGTMALHTIPYSQFKTLVAHDMVTNVVLGQNLITGQIVTNSPAKTPAPPKATVANELQSSNLLQSATNAMAASSFEAPDFQTYPVNDPSLAADLEKHHITYTGHQNNPMAGMLLAWIVPIAILFFLWRFLSRRMSGLGQSVLGFGSSRAKMMAEQPAKVTFNDVAGCDEAKHDLQEVVAFLKDPGRYNTLGATIPKGILLIGPPGTGKTLLARAVAGEAKVPFFFISGSDFVEMFVGVGAARVRDLFEKAKSKAPCIVFIDELDAVGRQRGVRIGSVNDEREQTLNQLLVGMDGFEANAGIIILAATNRPEVLDPALLRPGRFDRHVVVDVPDLEGRMAILKIHARGKRLAANMDFRRIAAQTPGLAGADLANVVNEAALAAAGRGALEITQLDLENAVERVVAGPERRSRRLSDDEKTRVAYHETGHALVAFYSKHADPVHKISIIPRGRAALGYTMQLPLRDQYLMSRSALLERIRVQLAGRAAEEVVFDEISTGAENDLQQATGLARQMVAMFGMSDRVGLAYCARREGHYDSFLPGGGPQRDCSEETAREIDEEVKKILSTAYVEARALLQQHRQLLEHIARELLQREVMDAATFRQLLQEAETKPDIAKAA